MRNYIQVLSEVHNILQPDNYVEVGVDEGISLLQALPKTKCFGVDPDPQVTNFPKHIELFISTSDDFFKKDVSSLLNKPLDFAFIDGNHLFDFVVRDFYNLEKLAKPDSVIALHDVIPANAETSTRHFAGRGHYWTGDVWKFLFILNEYRPDLKVTVVNTPPSGLGIITNLNPNSTVLMDNYETIVDKYMEKTFDCWDPTAINIVFDTEENLKKAIKV